MSRHLAILIVPLLALLAGCSETASEDIATSGIWADLSAKATDDATIEAKAIFRTGGALSNDYIELSGGDTVDATHDTTTQLMNKETFLAATQYVTTFSNLTKSSDELVAITLHRPDEAATNTNIFVPPTFAITAPDANTTFHISTNDAIHVTWDPFQSGDDMYVTYHYSCSAGGVSYIGNKLHQVQQDLGYDDTTVNEVLDTLDPAIDKTSISCDVTITVERRREQTVADAYKGGTARGIQSRQVYVTFVQ